MIGSLLRFSSGKDGEETKSDNVAEDAVMEHDASESYVGEDNVDVNDSSENHTSDNLPGENNQITAHASSDEVVPDNELDDVVVDEPELLPRTEATSTREKHYTLDELGEITRKTLADENIEVSKVKPFIWSVIEAYTDRFQAFPFDVKKALFNYLELDERPGAELIELVERIEALYEKQQGQPMRKPESPVKAPGPPMAPLITDMPTLEELLDEELKELRETLKYAAMVGERLDDTI